jgi:hypothetical protein
MPNIKTTWMANMMIAATLYADHIPLADIYLQVIEMQTQALRCAHAPVPSFGLKNSAQASAVDLYQKILKSTTPEDAAAACAHLRDYLQTQIVQVNDVADMKKALAVMRLVHQGFQFWNKIVENTQPLIVDRITQQIMISTPPLPALEYQPIALRGLIMEAKLAIKKGQ